MKSRGRVFVSYRREGGAELARLVHDNLKERGHDVFMDVEALRSGPFNTALFHEIESSTDVVVILTSGSLERCAKKDDWLRLEVAQAIKLKKNVVPVRARGFSFPSAPLPEEIKELPNFQGIEPSHEYFRASIDKLEGLLISRPRRRVRRSIAGGIAVACVLTGVLAAAALVIQSLRSSKPGHDSPSSQPLAQPTRSNEGVTGKQPPRIGEKDDVTLVIDETANGFNVLNVGQGTIQDVKITVYPPPLNENILLLAYKFTAEVKAVNTMEYAELARSDFKNEKGALLSASKRKAGVILVNGKVRGKPHGIAFTLQQGKWGPSPADFQWAAVEDPLLGPVEDPSN
jgi:hypothetical protein